MRAGTVLLLFTNVGGVAPVRGAGGAGVAVFASSTGGCASPLSPLATRVSFYHRPAASSTLRGICILTVCLPSPLPLLLSFLNPLFGVRWRRIF